MKKLRKLLCNSKLTNKDNIENNLESYPAISTYPTNEINFPSILVGNSFCQLAKFPASMQSAIKELLTYENEDAKDEIKNCHRLIRWAQGQGKKKTKMVYALRKKLDTLKEQEVVCWLKGDVFPTGHLSMVKDLLQELRYNDYELVDKRNAPSNFVTLRWRNKPFDPRYYQDDMIKLGLKQERGVFESAVGSGKSLVMEYLIKNLGVKSLIVVPSIPLLEQLTRSLTLTFGRDKRSVINTAMVKRGGKLAPIRITTAQTLAALQKNDMLRDVIHDIDALYVDEIHHAGAATYTNLLPDFDSIFYRFGFTGTFLRNDSRTLDMWGFLSNRLYHYPPYKAVEDGFLTPSKMIIEELPGKDNKDYNTEYEANYCGTTVLMGAILRLLDKIPKTEQILILVDRKDKSGAIIHELLKTRGIDNFYISGDDKKEHIADTMEAFNKKEVRVLVGSTVIGEGVDIHSTQHLILANGGKSPIKLVQAIGRCVRLHPGKKLSFIYDFCFLGTNYMEKHCQQRVDIFQNHFAGEVEWIPLEIT